VSIFASYSDPSADECSEAVAMASPASLYFDFHFGSGGGEKEKPPHPVSRVGRL
jgi:hypothetical protein